MNRSQVPYGGILLTCAVCVLGVGLNYLVPAQAFEVVLNVASLGIVSTWVIIMVCHLVFVRRAKAGRRTLLLIPLITAMLTAGWFAVRHRVAQSPDQASARQPK